ncbi:MAG: hypothetical protein ACRCXB_33650 [Aeromonadaceae bacterium]
MMGNYMFSIRKLPKEIRENILCSKLIFSKEYTRSKADELRELNIHLENAKFSGVSIIGGENAVNALQEITDEFIHIFAGKNKFYFFKLYISKSKHGIASFIMIKRNLSSVNNLHSNSEKGVVDDA